MSWEGRRRSDYYALSCRDNLLHRKVILQPRRKFQRYTRVGFIDTLLSLSLSMFESFQSRIYFILRYSQWLRTVLFYLL